MIGDEYDDMSRIDVAQRANTGRDYAAYAPRTVEDAAGRQASYHAYARYSAAPRADYLLR